MIIALFFVLTSLCYYEYILYRQIISLEGVCETWSGRGGGARALAFSVFSGARRLLSHQPNGKSLTGFGTAANANLFINNKDVSIVCTVFLVHLSVM